MKTDLQLRHEVERELEWDSSVDAARIGQLVDEGVVTLTGEVKTYVEKWNAERAVERVAGVRGVANEIKVRTAHEHNDSDIAKAIAASLEWSSILPANHVMIKVEHGYVTLSGEVAHEYQRREAERTVRYLRGVKEILNHIEIRPEGEAKNLKDKIVESFRRQAVRDAERITVEVKDGKVTLSGIVRSRTERREAERTVWAGSGVEAVENNLAVATAS